MDLAERAQRRRVAVLTLALTLFILMQVIALAASARIADGAVRAVDIAQLFAPGMLALGMSRGMFGAPMWLRNAHAKQAVNDELARDNRRRAVIAGFAFGGLTAFVFACLTPVLALPGYMVAQAIFSALIVVTVGRFIWLEWAGVLKAADVE
jgi:hypothetical protein